MSEKSVKLTLNVSAEQAAHLDARATRKCTPGTAVLRDVIDLAIIIDTAHGIARIPDVPGSGDLLLAPKDNPNQIIRIIPDSFL